MITQKHYNQYIEKCKEWFEKEYPSFNYEEIYTLFGNPIANDKCVISSRPHSVIMDKLSSMMGGDIQFLHGLLLPQPSLFSAIESNAIFEDDKEKAYKILYKLMFHINNNHHIIRTKPELEIKKYLIICLDDYIKVICPFIFKIKKSYCDAYLKEIKETKIKPKNNEMFG